MVIIVLLFCGNAMRKIFKMRMGRIVHARLLLYSRSIDQNAFTFFFSQDGVRSRLLSYSVKLGNCFREMRGAVVGSIENIICLYYLRASSKSMGREKYNTIYLM